MPKSKPRVYKTYKDPRQKFSHNDYVKKEGMAWPVWKFYSSKSGATKAKETRKFYDRGHGNRIRWNVVKTDQGWALVQGRKPTDEYATPSCWLDTGDLKCKKRSM